MPQITTILNDINQLLEDAGMEGQFPLLVGYYNRHLHNLLLIPAGLHSTLTYNGQHQVLETGVPPVRSVKYMPVSIVLILTPVNVISVAQAVELILCFQIMISFPDNKYVVSCLCSDRNPRLVLFLI